ncbi:DNA repair protein RecO [Mycoplasmatota bacterium zrk1]
MANNYEGILIKSIDYTDSSKIIYLITESGIVSLLAKGARKLKSPLRQLCQTISKISYNQSESKKLPIMYSGDVVNPYLGIIQDLEKTSYVSHIFEVIYKLSTDIDFSTLYKFLNITLDRIEKGIDVELISFVFELKFLYLLGINPVFNRCADCDSNETIGFDVYRGGMICSQHKTDYSIFDIEFITGIYKLYYHDLSKEFDYSINRKLTRKIIDDYYQHYMNFKSKSREIIGQIYGY